METSPSIKAISAALVKAQGKMGTAHKDASNPYFKSKYADLNAIREACMPALNENGISVLQPTVVREGKNFVQTILLHESGEYIASLTEIIYAKEKDAQAQGSGITYARRYGLQSLVNVGAEDDDGNKASQPQQVNGLPKKPELLPSMPAWKKAVKHIADGGAMSKVEETYTVSAENKAKIKTEADNLPVKQVAQ